MQQISVDEVFEHVVEVVLPARLISESRVGNRKPTWRCAEQISELNYDSPSPPPERFPELLQVKKTNLQCRIKKLRVNIGEISPCYRVTPYESCLGFQSVRLQAA